MSATNVSAANVSAVSALVFANLLKLKPTSDDENIPMIHLVYHVVYPIIVVRILEIGICTEMLYKHTCVHFL